MLRTFAPADYKFAKFATMKIRANWPLPTKLFSFFNIFEIEKSNFSLNWFDSSVTRLGDFRKKYFLEKNSNKSSKNICDLLGK